MKYWYPLALCISLSLVAQGGSIAPNDCSFSLKNHLLTCENITDWTKCNIGGHLNDDTKILMIKRSDELSLDEDSHSTAFGSLTSYHLVEVAKLTIAPYTFSNMSNLEYVKICDNGYDLIASDTFDGLTHLRVLNLNNNSIRSIEVGAFNDLANLETLELTHNDFQNVPDNLFEPLQKLKSLFLYHNNIETISRDSFQGLRNLNVLDLTYNRIQSIQASMFNELPLSQLYLSYNQIESIEGDFKIDTLEFLYLQNNKLRSVNDSVFSSLIGLIDADLSRNKISEISEFAFYNCSKLTNLNYKENGLSGGPINFNFISENTKPFFTYST